MEINSSGSDFPTFSSLFCHALCFFFFFFFFSWPFLQTFLFFVYDFVSHKDFSYPFFFVLLVFPPPIDFCLCMYGTILCVSLLMRRGFMDLFVI